MSSFITHTWSDDAKRRQVELNIDYTVEGESVYIHRITPVKVHFPGQNRTVRVHTAAGRELLVSAFQQSSGTLPILERLILSNRATAQPAASLA